MLLVYHADDFTADPYIPLKRYSTRDDTAAGVAFTKCRREAALLLFAAVAISCIVQDIVNERLFVYRGSPRRGEHAPRDDIKNFRCYW